MSKVFYMAMNGGKDTSGQTLIPPVVQPIRGNVTYEEVMDKLKETIGVVVTNYAKMMNSVLYLNETYHAMALRRAFMHYLPHYVVQFGFHDFSNILPLLGAIKQNSATIKRDAQNLIVRVMTEDVVDENEIAQLRANLVTMIQEEMKRIPLYRNGQAHYRFYDKGPFYVLSSNNLPNNPLPPFELHEIHHHLNIQIDTPTLTLSELTDRLFEQGYSEFHVSKGQNAAIINGLYFQKTKKSNFC